MSSSLGHSKRASKKSCEQTAVVERAPFSLRSKSGDSKTDPKDSDFARCFASKQIFGKMDTMPSPVSMKPA
jgi:hypothetical protein